MEIKNFKTVNLFLSDTALLEEELKKLIDALIENFLEPSKNGLTWRFCLAFARTSLLCPGLWNRATKNSMHWTYVSILSVCHLAKYLFPFLFSSWLAGLNCINMKWNGWKENNSNFFIILNKSHYIKSIMVTCHSSFNRNKIQMSVLIHALSFVMTFCIVYSTVFLKGR